MKTKKKTSTNKEEQSLTYNPTSIQKFNSTKARLFWQYVDRLAYKIDGIAKIYEKTIGKVYRDEREQFGLNRSKKILHIGCGSYPITAMVLAEMNDVKIVTIDQKHKSIEHSNKVISRKNLNNKIQAKYGNGTNFPLDGFDTIIISGCSVPKIDVLNHVIKNSKPKTKIIIRDSYFDIESIVDFTNSHKKIDIVEKIESKPVPLSGWTSFYLFKK